MFCSDAQGGQAARSHLTWGFAVTSCGIQGKVCDLSEVQPSQSIKWGQHKDVPQGILGRLKYQKQIA